jgi:hypothetical protein
VSNDDFVTAMTKADGDRQEVELRRNMARLHSLEDPDARYRILDQLNATVSDLLDDYYEKKFG